MQEEKKKNSGSPLLVVVIIIILAIILFNQNKKREKTDASTSDTETSSKAYIQNATPDSYYEIENNDYSFNEYGYPISMMGELSGVFILRESEGVLIQLPQSIQGYSISSINSYPSSNGKTPIYLGSTYVEPLVIDRSNGEKLVLLGNEGGNRAPSEAERIAFFPTKQLGYTMYSVRDQEFLSPDDYETVTGADFVEFICQGHGFGKTYILCSPTKGGTCEYARYEGTTYQTYKIQMNYPVFLIFEEEPWQYERVIRTTLGYFEIDITDVPSGLYTIDSYTGYYPLEIR